MFVRYHCSFWNEEETNEILLEKIIGIDSIPSFAEQFILHHAVMGLR